MLILCTQSLSEEERDRIQAAAPDAQIVAAPEHEEALKHAPEAEILFGHPREDLLTAAPRLRWVQVGSAGVEGALNDLMKSSDVMLTSSAGVFNVPIAEHLLAMILSFTRRLHAYRDRQTQRKWDRSPGQGELESQTIGIVGLGEIGLELAKRAQSLGVRVIGIKRSVPDSPPEGVEWVRGMDALLDLAAESDHVVDTLPNTPATRQVINTEVFAAMKPTSYFYNIGRGITVDQDAMIHALQNGVIAGAGLDVTTPEPLAEDSPLWELKNVILTPHVSGGSPRTRERQVEHFAENLQRYLKGEPLKSLVDKEAGY